MRHRFSSDIRRLDIFAMRNDSHYWFSLRMCLWESMIRITNVSSRTNPKRMILITNVSMRIDSHDEYVWRESTLRHIRYENRHVFMIMSVWWSLATFIMNVSNENRHGDVFMTIMRNPFDNKNIAMSSWLCLHDENRYVMIRICLIVMSAWLCLSMFMLRIVSGVSYIYTVYMYTQAHQMSCVTLVPYLAQTFGLCPTDILCVYVSQ